MIFQPLVSCIVPVYNAEKYLDQGLKSLLNQTYQQLEIILIDDCSKDGSWELCQKYANDYVNVLAFRNESNSGGPLRGRERGIYEAHGDWITFMDGDDYVRPGYIKNLVEATHDGKFDIAVTGHSRLNFNGKIEDFEWTDYAQTTNQRLTTFYKHFLSHDFWTDPTDTAGQSLVRASICKNTDLSKYSNLVYAEDTLMALAFLANSENGVNFVDKHDFIWRQIEGSGSNGGFSDFANKDEFFKSCFDIFHTPSVYDIVSKNSPTISVIVPVYNVEEYLEECLKSIVNQTYKNVEIIIINDGTTDESQKIIDEYKKIDNRIITIKQKNLGLNMARAAGAEVATGEYVAFVDSDDVVHEDYIKIMYETLLFNDVDISISGFKHFDKKGVINTSNKLDLNYSEQVINDRNDAIRYYLGDITSVPNVHQMTAWGKLYKAQIIKKTDWNFSNYRRNEDNLESLQWYSMADKGIAVVSTQLYYYRMNPNSITGTMQKNINPDGKELNYFEFNYELYIKVKKYLNDESFDSAILNQFAHTNRIQVQNFFMKGQLDKENMQSAINNWGEVVSIYNNQIAIRDEKIKQLEKTINDTHTSLSWKITKPLRGIKRIASKAMRK